MLRSLERVMLGTGLLLLGVFCFTWAEPQVRAAQSAQAFTQARQLIAREPDTALWSPERIAAYQRGATDQRMTAIGLLTIEGLDIHAPIFRGESDAVLDRGVGWIENTSRLGTAGNTGLAAHRDGFFRPLKDVEIGARVTVSTLIGDRHYRVTGMDVVMPDDVYVLEQTSKDTLTLITCYPFYFVGSAPQRFVVYATAIDT